MDEHLLRCKTLCSGGRQENSPTLKAARQEPSTQQSIGRTDIDMRSLLRTAPSDLAHILRQCRYKLQSGYPVLPSSSEGSLLGPLVFIFGGFLFLFFCFWHSCTNKLRFVQVRAPGSRCYCCNSAARQTVLSLHTPSLPGRLCNEGVIGLITLCLPILLLK